MKPLRTVLLFASVAAVLHPAAADTGAVVNAINALGLDLYRTQPDGDANLLFSPYLIQNGLAMVYAGADGDTHTEMRDVLHYPRDEAALHAGFAELAKELAQITKDTSAELHLANQLFVQRGYKCRAPFLSLLKDNYDVQPEQLDFAHAPEDARAAINQWTEDNTKGKIRDLVPPNSLRKWTRLALANAIYLRAYWANPFEPEATKPAPFFVHGSESVMVPTMVQQHLYGYAYHSFRGYTAVSLPYEGDNLQFVILLPDARNGLAALERDITLDFLAECAKLPQRAVILYLPKFRFTSQSMLLGVQLRQLGLKTAFDEPFGSANFDRLAPRKPDDYLSLGEVFHQAFIAIDEKETEAAAADTLVLDTFGVSAKNSKPIEVRVDHPFFFAIQHVPSGACLFLGRVTDPRE
ncbi:MAG TPA: serpin family protein [Opitutaceae bacterium]|nr:serpin family protein [Opitutaceae bacterium]